MGPETFLISLLLLGGLSALAFGGGDDDDDETEEESGSFRALGDGDDVTRGFSPVDDAGDDTIRGQAGDDLLVDFSGSNFLAGDTGNDFIVGTDAVLGEPDRLAGGFGNDSILGDDGDTLDGGEGDDLFGILYSQEGAEPVLITEPVEELLITVTESLNGPLDQSYDSDADTLSIFVGDAEVARIEGSTSIDLGAVLVEEVDDDFDIEEFLFGPIITGDGDDFVDNEGLGNSISTGEGSDSVVGGLFNDRVDLGGGNDFYISGDPEFDGGDDRVFGRQGADTIVDGIGSDFIDGGFGNDEIYAAGDPFAFSDIDPETDREPDTIFGGAGDDFITVDFGDQVTTGTGEDEVYIRVDTLTNPAAVVFISDFDPVDDSLVVEDLVAPTSPGTLSFVAEGDATLVQLTNAEDTPITIARVAGVTPAQLSAASVRV